MFMIPLQSGSNGNSIYVEAGDTRLLFDAGISGKRARERLAEFGRDIRDVQGLILSHDHADHARCAGIYQRKFGLPIWVTPKTLEAADRRHALGAVDDIRSFEVGQRLTFGRVTVETVPTPHDGADGAAFVVDDGHDRLGILTDLGHVFDELEVLLDSLDAVLLESNYDPDMLANGGYPAFLKERIRGRGGHLSNLEAAELLHKTSRTRWACLAHLSEENNHPKVAVNTHHRVLGPKFPLHVASRYQASGPFEV